MVDFIIIAVIVTPAIPSIILRNIRTTEMINAVLFPTLGINLRPFHHRIAAERSIGNTGCSAVDFFGIIVGIEIMIHHTCIGQHTGTRHKHFSRLKIPTAVIKGTSKVHLCRSKIGIVNVGWIGNTS